jgi:hypothetical protein
MSASRRADSAAMITVEAERLRIEGDEATVNIRKNVVLKNTPKEVSAAWTSSSVASISYSKSAARMSASRRADSAAMITVEAVRLKIEGDEATVNIREKTAGICGSSWCV